jgi:hypothetical protein
VLNIIDGKLRNAPNWLDLLTIQKPSVSMKKWPANGSISRGALRKLVAASEPGPAEAVASLANSYTVSLLLKTIRARRIRGIALSKAHRLTAGQDGCGRTNNNFARFIALAFEEACLEGNLYSDRSTTRW